MFYTGGKFPIEKKLQLVIICDAVKLSYTDLRNQPAWWVNYYQYYLQGKHKAEEALAKKKSK